MLSVERQSAQGKLLKKDNHSQSLTSQTCFCSEIPMFSHLFYLPSNHPDVKLSIIADSRNKSYVQKQACYLMTEYVLTKAAAHRHVVATFGFVCEKNDQQVIILEHCVNGDLLDRLRLVGGLSEPVARRIMKQLLTGLHHCHRLGIAHLDVMPENVFLDEKFSVRLGDFGHSRRVGAELLRNYTLGTPRYMAPEILSRTPYDGFKADVFSAGVVLFMLLTAHHPFGMAAQTDQHFNWLQRAPGQFWEAHAARAKLPRVAELSPDFKELVRRMTTLEPKARLSLHEVFNHVWMRGETASMDIVREELNDF